MGSQHYGQQQKQSTDKNLLNSVGIVVGYFKNEAKANLSVSMQPLVIRISNKVLEISTDRYYLVSSY